MYKMKIKIIFLISFICIISICVCLFWEGNKGKVNYMDYIYNLIGLDLSQDAELVEGTIKHDGGEESVFVCFHVIAGNKNLLIQKCEDTMGKPINPDEFILPNYSDQPLYKELNELNIKFTFYKLISGKGAKSRTIVLYVACDKDGEMYIYIFG